MDWLDQRYIEDLDPRAERALRAAGQSFEHDTIAEQWLLKAASIAPDHPAILLGHYRYHLYKHHYHDAEHYARRCLAVAADELGIPNDPLAARATHADFASSDPRVRFWLYGVQALGYVIIRAGRTQQGIALLRKLVELDPSDQTKTLALLHVIEQALVAPEP